MNRDKLKRKPDFQHQQGEVVWLLGLLGLSAWKQDGSPLAEFLYKECNLHQLPFSFSSYHKGVLMKTLRTKKGFMTLLINKTPEQQQITLTGQNTDYKPEIIFNNHNGKISDSRIELQPEGTLVIHWEP